MSLTPEPAGVAQGALFPAGRLDAARACYRVMSCDVQTFSRSASNPNSATASRDFAMNGTSTSAPGLVTSSRQHSTVNCRPTLRRRGDNPSPAENPASSGTAGAPCSTDPVSPRSRRTRAARRSASPTAGATLGRLRSPRSSPVTGSASLSATPASRRGSRPARQALGRPGVDRRGASTATRPQSSPTLCGSSPSRGDQRHGRPVQGRSRRDPHPAAEGNCRYPHRDRRSGNQAHPLDGRDRAHDGGSDVRSPAVSRQVTPNAASEPAR